MVKINTQVELVTVFVCSGCGHKADQLNSKLYMLGRQCPLETFRHWCVYVKCIYQCMQAKICVNNIIIYCKRMRTWIFSRRVRTPCMYIRTYVRVHACMYLCMHVCMYVCMYEAYLMLSYLMLSYVMLCYLILMFYSHIFWFIKRTINTMITLVTNLLEWLGTNHKQVLLL